MSTYEIIRFILSKKKNKIIKFIGGFMIPWIYMSPYDITFLLEWDVLNLLIASAYKILNISVKVEQQKIGGWS